MSIPFRHGIVAAKAAGPDISVLNALADTGATNDSGTTNSGSFTVSAGTNRTLVALQHTSGVLDSSANLVYGGQTMTKRVSVTSAGGFPAIMQIWTLDEAGIAAATANTFDANDVATGSYRLTAVALENVDQSNPVVDSGSGVESSGNPADVVLTTEDGGYAVAGLRVDIGATGDNTWGADFTERVDVETSPTGSAYSSADALTDGTNVTADPTTNGTNTQQCQAAISLRKAA